MIQTHLLRVIAVAGVCLVFLVEPAIPQQPARALPANAFDRLKADDIPKSERFPWHPKELVAVFGSHAWRYWRMGHLVTDGKQVTVRAWNSLYDPGAIGVWDAATAKELRQLKVPRYNTMSFSPRGGLVAFARESPADWALTVLEFPAGKVRHKLTAKGTAPLEMNFSPTGKLLALSRGSVEVIDPATGRQLMSRNYHWGPVFHPGGRLVYSYRDSFRDDDGTKVPGRVYQEDLVTKKERVLYEVPKDTALRLAVSPDGRWLGIGNRMDGKVFLWEVYKSKATLLLTQKEGLFSLAFSSDSRSIACGLYDRRVRLYDLATGQERITLGSPQSGQPVDQLTFSSDSKRLAALAIVDYGVLHWDVATGEALHTANPLSRLLATSADGNLLLFASAFDQRARPGQFGGLQVHDMVTGKRRDLVLDKDIAAVSAEFTPDGRSLVILVQVPGHTALRVYDPKTLKETASRLFANGEASEICISPDGKTLAAGALHGGRIVLHETANWNQRAAIAGTGTAFSGMAFSGDGKTLVASTNDGLKLIDVAEGRVRTTFPTERQGAVTVSPDGKRVAITVHGSGAVVVLDAVTGDELYNFKGHDGIITGVCFFRDSASTLSAGIDGKIIRWFSPPTKKEWRFPGPITAMRLSPEGRHLLVNVGNATTYVLRLEEMND